MNYAKTIPATEAKTHFGRLVEDVQRAPIAITKQGRVCSVMVSPQDYNELINKQLGDAMDDASAYAKKQGLTKAELQNILSS